MSRARVIFYYDVVCPFAYMASRLVEAMAQRTGAEIVWRPVLLGGIYDLIKAPQGKGGSSRETMSPAKLKIQAEDLRRQLVRRRVLYRDPTHFPQKTVYAMRMLAGLENQATTIALSHSLYQAHFCEDRNLGDMECLREIAAGHGVDAEALIHSNTASQQLRQNTAEVVERGGFGVPSFYVNGRLFWGTDRMFFVERAIGNKGAGPERLTTPTISGAAKLSFYFDYSSPWSYIGFVRLGSLVRSVAPVEVNIEYVPILLGALFKEIGTAQVSTYLAAWRDNRNIGEHEVCRSVLEEAGFDAESLLQKASSEPVKKLLFANTSRAVSEGLCGVPSYQVNNSSQVIWGQDKQSTVEDLICGWSDITTAAKL